MGKATALITGASRGIGRGIALELAAHGNDIVGVATKADPNNTTTGLYEVKARVEALGRVFVPLAGDIARLDNHDRLVREALDAVPSIDILVNNAGVAPLQRLDILDTTDASYDRVMGINLRGPFFFTQRVAEQMVRQVKNGAAYKPIIVFVTSISANTASPNRAEYCISKAGLAMAAQTFAVRLAEFGINVYDLRPGIVSTDMTSAVKQKYDDLIAKGLLLQPRWGTPGDVGKAVLALAEGYFAYATGAVIEIGGGFGVQRL
jgi:NAD(P)-dependent dehydrogenase (short-subunit alcohol dehydrogenase family)